MLLRWKTEVEAISRAIGAKHTSTDSDRLSQFWNILPFVFFFTLLVVFHNQLALAAHWDTGWIRHVIWRNPAQHMPETCCAVDGENSNLISWSWHFVPLFSLFSVASYLWPFGEILWTASFFALPYALIVQFMLAFARICGRNRINKSSFVSIALALIVIGFSLGTFRSIQFPHYEIYYLSFSLMLLYFLIQKRIVMVFLATFLCFSVKEDSLIYLMILYVAFFLSKSNIKRVFTNSLLLCIPALIYLLAMEFLEFADPPNPDFPDQSSLQSQYLGTPPLKHINFGFLLDRIYENLKWNFELYLFVIVLTIAAARRSRSLATRFLLCLSPHVLVAWIGFAETKGIWVSYHQVPIWTSVLLFLLVLEIRYAFFASKAMLVIILIFSLLSYYSFSVPYVAKGLISTGKATSIYAEVDEVIRSALVGSDVLDSNFFFYDPSLVSVNSWLRDNSQFPKNGCLVHLQNSVAPQKLQQSLKIEVKSQVPIGRNFQRTCFE
jgi:hypothetical protein